MFYQTVPHCFCRHNSLSVYAYALCACEDIARNFCSSGLVACLALYRLAETLVSVGFPVTKL